eukprot:TRINITY_DN22776_c0_g1_i1.p1 TRINITY_DN22776_c0_g1~~TRINITY_DN22776_c0_g1_i1.p1  ORF type:complete len:666 (+),score=139.02 TRINITY_DN22776_c0_g1_i1:265-1998(+)
MLMRTLADGRRHWDVAKINRSVALVEQFVSLQPAEADEVLFNAILDTHSRTKDVPKLEATFQHMKELGVEPSHVTLGILVKAYGQVCDFKQVLALWDEMAEQREQANAVTYGCMINACVKCSQTSKALEIFREMQKKNKQCNTILYTTLIKGYGNEKDADTAIMLFREMKDAGVPYNTIAYNSIIDVCIKCGEISKGEDFFREIICDGSSVQPDLITYSTLLKGYCQAGDLDKALQVAATIKASGMQCDELVYNTLMDGCVKANDLSAGVGLFAEMAQAGMKPSAITHSIFLRLYQRNGYKGNAMDAVAQLYQHHGLEKPSGMIEKASKVAARRDNRGRGQKNRGEGQGGGRELDDGAGLDSQGYEGWGSSGSKGGCNGPRRSHQGSGYGDSAPRYAGMPGPGWNGCGPCGGCCGGCPHPQLPLGLTGGMPGMGMHHQHGMPMDPMSMQHLAAQRHGMPLQDASQRMPGSYSMMGVPMPHGGPQSPMPGLESFSITSRPATFGGMGLDEHNMYAGRPMGSPQHQHQMMASMPGADSGVFGGGQHMRMPAHAGGEQDRGHTSWRESSPDDFNHVPRGD